MMPDMGDLPPFVREAIEAQQKQAQAFDEVATEIFKENRMRQLRWAALLCTCNPWRVPGQPHAAEGCMVHGGFWISDDGSVIL